MPPRSCSGCPSRYPSINHSTLSSYNHYYRHVLEYFSTHFGQLDTLVYTPHHNVNACMSVQVWISKNQHMVPHTECMQGSRLHSKLTPSDNSAGCCPGLVKLAPANQLIYTPTFIWGQYRGV